MSDFIIVTDDLGREVSIPFPPKRIISTVPSTTEFLFDLGVGNRVISRTRYCRYPKTKIEKLPNIGGPKDLHLDKIKLLDPDLILANEEENSKNQIETLMKEFPVYVSKVRNLEQALQNILSVGRIINAETRSFEIANSIRLKLLTLPKNPQPIKCLYLIWNDPYMSVSKDTFINSILEICGFSNVIENVLRYPKLSVEEIQFLNPDLVLLSSEPFPFAQVHINQIQKILPHARIELVDGEMFSWHESHLESAGTYLKAFLEKLNT